MAKPVTIGFFLTDNTGAIMGGSDGAALLAGPLPGSPEPYDMDPGATWTERFTPTATASKVLNYVSYSPHSSVLQVVYVSGATIYLPNIPPDVRTALFLADHQQKYALQLISVVPAARR